MKAIHVIAVKKETVLWEWDQLAAWIYFNLREDRPRAIHDPYSQHAWLSPYRNR